MATKLIGILPINRRASCVWCARVVALSGVHRAPYVHLLQLVASCSTEPSLRPKLTPQEASKILRHNEYTIEIGGNSPDPMGNTKDDNNAEKSSDEDIHRMYSIASIDSNQLAANSPIEDKIMVARCLLTTGFLFGVFDGHGGPECSQVVAKRLFDYIAAALLSWSQLNMVVEQWQSGSAVPLTRPYNDESSFIPELQIIYDTSLLQWCRKLLEAGRHSFSMEQALTEAFQQLDEDIGMEVKEAANSEIWEPLVRIAMSGSVACVAHIDGAHLHIANTGDCGAVLGRQRESVKTSWIADKLTAEHNWENSTEVERVISEHPEAEADTVVRNQRLLGYLMPFRAFGDFRFKWSGKLQAEVLGNHLEPENFVHLCLTPPYLVVTPEITYHRLAPQDRFLVLGSDGLWECMSVRDVVTLVGEYMCGRQTLQPVQLPVRPVTLGEIAQLLDQRQEGLRLKPTDTNAATHLIRHCIGGSDTGLNHGQLSHSLTLPPEVRRYFRDDISIHVIFFDVDFLRTYPVEV